MAPGDHLTMVREPHVAVVAAHLRRVVDEQRLSDPPPADIVGGMTDPASGFPVVWDDPADAQALDAALRLHLAL